MSNHVVAYEHSLYVAECQTIRADGRLSRWQQALACNAAWKRYGQRLLARGLFNSRLTGWTYRD